MHQENHSYWDETQIYARLGEVFQDAFEDSANRQLIANSVASRCQLAHRLFAIGTPVTVIAAASRNE